MFCFLCVFLDIVVFCINYVLKPYSYYFFIIIWLSIYMNLYFTAYSRVLGYFWLSRLKPRKTKSVKNIKPKNKKNKFLILKNIVFSTPGEECFCRKPLYEISGVMTALVQCYNHDSVLLRDQTIAP